MLGERGYSLQKLQKEYEAKNPDKSKKKKKSKKDKGKAKEIGVSGKGKGDDFKLNVGDSRFKNLFTDSEFAIDPTNPQFKNTQGTADLLSARHKHYNEEKQTSKSKKKRNRAKKSKTESVKDTGLRSLISKFKAKASRK